LVARKKVKQPFLSPTHKRARLARARLAWARLHRGYVDVDWRDVLFSDETKFECFPSQGRDWVWRTEEKHQLAEREVKPAKKYAGGLVSQQGNCRDSKSPSCPGPRSLPISTPSSTYGKTYSGVSTRGDRLQTQKGCGRRLRSSGRRHLPRRFDA